MVSFHERRAVESADGKFDRNRSSLICPVLSCRIRADEFDSQAIGIVKRHHVFAEALKTLKGDSPLRQARGPKVNRQLRDCERSLGHLSRSALAVGSVRPRKKGND